MKKIISILITLCMTGSMTTAFAVDYGAEFQNMPEHTYEQTFTDVPKSHWAFKYIGELVNDNVIDGYPDGKFRPENNVSRAEFAKIMITASGIKAVPTTVSSFSDVDVHEWYCPYIESAKEFLTGYQYSGYAMYLPDKMAIREDIAVALVKLKGYDVSVADLGMLKSMFSDYSSISEAAKKYVAVAVERGLVSGYDDGTFKGQQSITRAEAATLIWRANQYGSDNKVLGSETAAATAAPSATPSAATISLNTSATENPQSEVTPIPQSEKKPYVIRKLTSANVKNTDCMTMDNSNNIYYIDNDCIYKLNTSNGSKSTFMDLSDLSLKKTEKQDVEVEEQVTETVETGEYKEVEETVEEEVEETIEEDVTETVIDEETGEEKQVTKTVQTTVTKTVPKTVIKKVPITKEETKTVTKTIIKDVVVADYSGFVPYQIKYDTGINKLFLCGKYTYLEQPYKGKQKVSNGYYVLYEITNGKERCVIENKPYYYGIALNNDVTRLYYHSSYRYYEYNLSDGEVTSISDDSLWGYCYYADYIKIGNNLYRFVMTYDYDIPSKAILQKFNFSSSRYENIAEYKTPYLVAVRNNCIYFWEYVRFQKMSVSDGSLNELTINTDDENIEFEDMVGLPGTGGRLFVIDDNTMIFYDKNMKAFRILEKNK